MAGSVNKVFLIGYLGADPELKYTPSGRPVCNMRIATSEHWKDRDGTKQERTEWHSITVWGDQGEACAKYLEKGRLCAVEGKLQTESYDKDGVKHYRTKVVSERVTFLGGGGRRDDEPAGRAPERREDGPGKRSDNEDIPF